MLTNRRGALVLAMTAPWMAGRALAADYPSNPSS
jgi:hypothetical protein